MYRFTGKEPAYSFDHPPPPGQQLWPNLVGCDESWVRFDSTLVSDLIELSRSWVRLANLGFQLSRSWVNKKSEVLSWVRVESRGRHMSQSRVNPKNLSRAQPCSHNPCQWKQILQLSENTFLSSKPGSNFSFSFLWVSFMCWVIDVTWF